MDKEHERLEMLLAIARKPRLSLDDLDDASRDMDNETFKTWSEKVLRGYAADQARNSA